MEPLVRASLALRTVVRRGHVLFEACALSAYVACGGASHSFGPLQWGLAGVWAALLASRSWRKLREPRETGLLRDLEVCALLVVGGVVAVLRLDGSLVGPLSPAIYVLVALMAAVTQPAAGILAVAWLLALEAAVRAGPYGEGFDSASFSAHAGFVVALASLNLVLLRAEMARIRATARVRIDAQLLRLKEDARTYRLLGAGEARGAGDGGRERLARASVEEIHQSVHYALELLRRSLDLHTAVLLWLNDAGTHFRISELSTASDAVSDAPVAAGDGVLGAVLSQRAPVTLHGLGPAFKVPYYTSVCPVRVLTAIPVLDGDALRGVLVMDRVKDVPFTPHEEEVGSQAARFCLRAIQNERVFVQLERAKVEQGKLYRAAQQLGAALTEADVVGAGVAAAREIASFDAAAVTVFDPDDRSHEVVAAQGDAVAKLVGVRFGANTGLVSMVVQNRYPLPYRGEHDGPQKVVLSKRVPWPAHPSLFVLPLVIHDRALGTLILSAKRRHAFGDAVRPTLEVLASHLAVSLSNARMVHKLETMATTDALTSLLNRRAMLESGSQKIAAAARFSRRLSLLVVDIDHFKRVNDTYGHDTGDIVIRGLADVLKRQKRTTDVVARFGGEEFVLLCEQTDEAGALLLAERIRDDLAKTAFRTAHGSISVTCSIGIATFPEAGRDWDALFRAADEALYVSKRTGRDRCTVSREAQKASAKRQGLDRATASGK
jgi:diguanylate cyclase (GGDEF)-like protein